MIEILIVAHGNFSTGLKSAAEMIMGEIDHLETLCFHNGDSLEELVEKIKSFSQSTRERGNQPLILADILGGTPFNKILEAEIGNDTIIITGANLPLLLAIQSLNYSDNIDAREEAESIIENVKNNHMKLFIANDLPL